MQPSPIRAPHRGPELDAPDMSTPLNRYFAAGDALARLQDHARALMRAQEALRGMLPQPFAAACSVANLRDGKLVVHARNGGVASRLRQMVPSLVQGFATRGHPVQAIEVKVGLVVEPEPPPPPAPREIGEAGRRSMEAFVQQLPEDSPLRASLQRLLDRSR